MTYLDHICALEASFAALTQDLKDTMNLRLQMQRALPDVLPTSAAEAIGGSEVLQRLNGKIDKYAPASVRMQLSTLAHTPGTGVHKVRKSQGYYYTPEETLPTAKEIEEANHLRETLKRMAEQIDEAFDVLNRIIAEIREL